MLDFSARKFVEISHCFGLMLGDIKRQRERTLELMSTAYGELHRLCQQLGLNVTKECLTIMWLELIKENPQSYKPYTQEEGGGFRLENVHVNVERNAHHIETLYNTMLAELDGFKFKVIPRERNVYSDDKWLTETALFGKYPDLVDEFQRAGRCFAYGENTACVFHLMRVADFCLRKVAASLDVPYDARNWAGIAEKITKEIEKKYKAKSDEWKRSEPFYAEILTDIQALGRGHRNPVLHEIEKKYEEREASYMLTVIESFAEHVAKNL